MNIKNKHSPRTWTCERFQGYLGNIVDSEGNVIVYEEGCFMTEEGEANARLIASAPELLEALKECVSKLERLDPDGNSQAYAKGCYAISKAEGRDL